MPRHRDGPRSSATTATGLVTGGVGTLVHPCSTTNGIKVCTHPKGSNTSTLAWPVQAQKATVLLCCYLTMLHAIMHWWREPSHRETTTYGMARYVHVVRVSNERQYAMGKIFTGEPKRGCGFRKLGGIYLVSDPGAQLPCHVMPYPLLPCECCGLTVPFSRGYGWVRPRYFTADCKNTDCPAHRQCVFTMPNRIDCPACDATGKVFSADLATVAADLGIEDDFESAVCRTCGGTGNMVGKVGLMWVGREFYPKGSDFVNEAVSLGVSKRIPTVPRNLVLGKTWVMLARKNDTECPVCSKTADGEFCDACEGTRKVSIVFYAFRPTRIEMIVTADMLEQPCSHCKGTGCDACRGYGVEPSKLAERCARQNITTVVVNPSDLEDDNE